MGEFNDWNSFWNPQPTGNCMGLSKVSKRSCENFHTVAYMHKQEHDMTRVKKGS